MRRRFLYAGFGAAAAFVLGAAVGAQATTGKTPGAPTAPESAQTSAQARGTAPAPDIDLPFSVGEQATYDVKFGIVHVGRGSMRVANVQTLRDHDVWHTILEIKGGTLFYHVNDTLESWFDTRTLSSLRFVQRLDEGGKIRNRDYEMFPERAAFVYNQKPEQPSVPEPLDDGSFLYFVRTLPLNVGDTYVFNRYFNPKANPVTIHVLRKERITVPAGTFNAIVVEPVIKTSGIFSKNGEAKVWFSDDSARVVLQMKSKLSFGSLNLYLRAYEPGRGQLASKPTGAAPATLPVPMPRTDTPPPPPAVPVAPPATPASDTQSVASPPAQARIAPPSSAH